MNEIRYMMLFSFGIASIWDGFTTVTGTVDVLGSGWPQLFAGAVFALVILGFLIGTSYIHDKANNEIIYVILKYFWWLALAYDLFTSYVGNNKFILGGASNLQQQALLVGLTAFVSFSPVVLSLMWKDGRSLTR